MKCQRPISTFLSILVSALSVVNPFSSAVRGGPANPTPGQQIPEEAYRLNDAGKTHFDKKEYDKAIELLLRAIQLAPNYAEAYKNLAVVYTGKREYEKSISYALKAIEMTPEDGEYHAVLASAYYWMNDLDKAITAFRKAIQLGDRRAKVYSVLGNTYLKKEMLQEAITAFKKALELDPSLQGARNNLRMAEEMKRSRKCDLESGSNANGSGSGHRQITVGLAAH